MDDLNRLPNIFSAKEAIEHGVGPYILLRSVENGTLEKIHRGVYRKVSTPDGGLWEILLSATKRLPGPSAVGLLSALAYHGLTDSIPEKVWLIVDRHTRTSLNGLKVMRLSKPCWDVGIEEDEGLKITTIERTIVDLIAHRDTVGPLETYLSLKDSISNQRTSAYKILQVAKEMKLEKRIRPSLEPFLYER